VTVALAGLTGCGSDTSSSVENSSGVSSSSFSAQNSAPAEPSRPESYSTEDFMVPMTVTVDIWLTTVTPQDDSAHLIYWSAKVDD
jgi:hypothetical protein